MCESEWCQSFLRIQLTYFPLLNGYFIKLINSLKRGRKVKKCMGTFDRSYKGRTVKSKGKKKRVITHTVNVLSAHMHGRLKVAKMLYLMCARTILKRERGL